MFLSEYCWGSMLSSNRGLKWCNYLPMFFSAPHAVSFLSAVCLIRNFNWVNAKCFYHIERVNCADPGNIAFERSERSKVIAQEFQKHVEKILLSITQLPRCSKRYWELNRQLLHRKAKSTRIPHLRRGGGNWALDAREKANILACAFASKSHLPVKNVDFPVVDPNVYLDGYVFIRTRWVFKILRALDASSSTGTGHLPDRILKECASVISWVFACIVSSLVRNAGWPALCKFHWVHPLFKSGSVSDPHKYRVIHLVCVLSKIAEKVNQIYSLRILASFWCL